MCGICAMMFMCICDIVCFGGYAGLGHEVCGVCACVLCVRGVRAVLFSSTESWAHILKQVALEVVVGGSGYVTGRKSGSSSLDSTASNSS